MPNLDLLKKDCFNSTDTFSEPPSAIAADTWKDPSVGALFSDPKPLKKKRVLQYTRIGIPHEIRSVVWPQIVEKRFGSSARSMGSYRESLKKYYQAEIPSVSNCNIMGSCLNLVRHFTALSPSGYTMAARIVDIIAHDYADIDYCPYLLPLAVILLHHLTEDDVLFVLRSLVGCSWTRSAKYTIRQKKKKPHYVYMPISRNDTLALNAAFDEYVMKKRDVADPATRIEGRNNSKYRLWARWFCDFFVGVLPVKFIFRVIDEFLGEGFPCMFRYASALIQIRCNEAMVVAVWENIRTIFSRPERVRIPVEDLAGVAGRLSAKSKDLVWLLGVDREAKSAPKPARRGLLAVRLPLGSRFSATGNQNRISEASEANAGGCTSSNNSSKLSSSSTENNIAVTAKCLENGSLENGAAAKETQSSGAPEKSKELADRNTNEAATQIADAAVCRGSNTSISNVGKGGGLRSSSYSVEAGCGGSTKAKGVFSPATTGRRPVSQPPIFAGFGVSGSGGQPWDLKGAMEYKQLSHSMSDLLIDTATLITGRKYLIFELPEFVQDVESGQSFVTDDHWAIIWKNVPAYLRMYKLKLLFDTSVHGRSFSTFYRLIQEYEPLIFFIKTLCGHVLGAVITTLISEEDPFQKKFLGTSESFLFSLVPKVRLYHSAQVQGMLGVPQQTPSSESSSPEHHQQSGLEPQPYAQQSIPTEKAAIPEDGYMYITRKELMIGSGDGGFAIFISNTLDSGSSTASATFRSPPLVPAAGGMFEIETLLVYSKSSVPV